MSVLSVWRIHRTGRTNTPALPSAAYGVDDMGIMFGLFGVAPTPSTVVVSRGFVELMDSLAGTVTLSDQLAQTVELRDAAAGSVGVSDG